MSSSVRSLGSKPVGECVSTREPKDTFGGSSQGKSPCEMDGNERLVDGRIENRIGVHVESEAVLKCEGNNKERVRHAVLDARTTVLRDTTIPDDSMTHVLSHARKITCAGDATYAWVWCSVYTDNRQQTTSNNKQQRTNNNTQQTKTNNANNKETTNKQQTNSNQQQQNS